MADRRPTVWILGDQLDPTIGPLKNFEPGQCRVLLVRSVAKVASKRWHRQRAHLVLSGMAHLAAELRDDGWDVDERTAPTLAAGLAAHREEFAPDEVLAMAPMSWDGERLLERLGVTVSPNEQFLCPYDEFAEWAAGRKQLKMEDFYRRQRLQHEVLMEGDEPIGGRWNLDDENRQPPPKDGRSWPEITRFQLDEIDRAVLADLDAWEGGGSVELWGADPVGLWPVTRRQARTRLAEFVADGLAPFGPHEDAMLAEEWKLAHSTLSSSMNLGLLHPAEVVEAAETAYRDGGVPLNSAEGFIRQVLGWREYVWGVFWLWMPDYRTDNALDARRPVPPVLRGEASTEMACVANVMSHVHDHGFAHHIERLMVLGNLALTAGVDPRAMTDWMWESFVDGAEWVMLPNVIGMALHADGGRMATKPYASGGAYLNRMSDHCSGCRFDPKKRTGPSACPFTTLYWDFLARNESRLASNHRMSRAYGGMRRLADMDQVRERAVVVLDLLDEGLL